MSSSFAEKAYNDQIHPRAASTTTISSFLHIPTEIRYLVYEELICLPHTLIIALRGYQLGIMEPLALTCSQLHDELTRWVECHARRHSDLIIDRTFGLLNPKTTWVLDSWDMMELVPGTLPDFNDFGALQRAMIIKGFDDTDKDQKNCRELSNEKWRQLDLLRSKDEWWVKARDHPMPTSESV
jgi:hypothetical protein